jgi:hypothetical protein
MYPRLWPLWSAKYYILDKNDIVFPSDSVQVFYFKYMLSENCTILSYTFSNSC